LAAEHEVDAMERACSVLDGIAVPAYQKIIPAMFKWISDLPDPHPEKKYHNVARVGLHFSLCLISKQITIFIYFFPRKHAILYFCS